MKSYVQLTKAWYGDDNLKLSKGLIDEVCVFIDDETDEIVISWKWLNNSISCEILMFDSSWSAFKKCPELFLALAELKNEDSSPEPDDVCAVLKKLGFKDKTQKKQ